jgi:diguanylate cyclase (GGDEF)-like protein
MTLRLPTTAIRPLNAAFAVGMILTAGYFLLPDGLVQSVGYNVIGLLAIGGVAVGIRINRPADSLTWWLFAVGSLCSIGADVVLTVYSSLGIEPATPSIADGLYLAAYPFLFCAVVRLGHRAAGLVSRERWTDAAIVTLGVLALTWQVLMGSYAHDNTLSTAGKLTLMLYPIMDIGVLFVVVSSLAFAGVRGTAPKIIGLAMAVLLAGDVAYDLLALHGAYTPGSLVDATWLINYVLIGVAALHPSMATARAHGPQPPRSRLSWMPILALAAFAAPTLLLVTSLTGGHADVPVLAVLSLVLAGLVTARMSWMFGSMSTQARQLIARTESLQQALVERDTLAADLRHQAFHDSLTGLANRALLHDRVEHALARSARELDMIALILIDLDGFKNVNDSLGHRAGDSLLVTVASRISAMVRPSDTVARLGGDEFAVLMESVVDQADAIAVANRVVAALREPCDVGEHSIALSASAGITFGTAKKSTEQLLSESDAAMYEAKARGKNRHEVFEPWMRSRVVERLQLTGAFTGAIEREEFYLDFQPIFALDVGRLTGFEALLRWRHPVLGLVAPLRFIPLAEEAGFIVPLGRWVLNAACRTATAWSGTTVDGPAVAVNVSARQLQDATFVADVRDALASSGLPGERLILEITESTLVGDLQLTINVLEQVKLMGISIAIDDFGTGYSSLSHLRKFPFDILKIDKSFIDHLDGAHTQGDAFVEAIVRLARELHVAAVAEGIEARSQQDALAAMGCDSGQGFLLSRPLDTERAAELARRAAAGETLIDFADQDSVERLDAVSTAQARF